MLKRKMTLVLLLMVLVTLVSGCSTTSVYLLEEREIVRVKQDDMVNAKYNGWLLSDRAVDRVMNAKIKRINLQ